MNDWVYKNKPYAHQKEVFECSRDKESFALLMEMGTGKTFVTLNTAGWLYANGKIDAVLIVAPNGLNRLWCDQTEEHMPDYVNAKAAYYCSSPNKKEEENLCAAIDHQGLKIVAMNVESLATAKGVTFARNFLNSFRSMMVLDESSTIKNPKAIRTKNLLKLSRHAKYRRILTGTPITQGPLDLYTQFGFLDSTILRTSSFFSFRNTYAIIQPMRLGNARFDKVTGYQNLDALQKLIAPHSYRVTKVDCLDLPEKLYSKRYVELSASQRHLYSQLKKEVVAEFNGMAMSAPLALTKLLRLQQIVGGFFVPDTTINCFPTSSDWELGEIVNASQVMLDHTPQPIDKVNPRVESLIELLEETNGKVIIWARFRAEIGEICRRIVQVFGRETLVEYHGGIENSVRAASVEKFQNDPETRFFIGHVQAGGKGLTLHAAKTVVYFSNDFSLENRLQSEDRAHRIGQKNNVTYIDFVAPNTLDEKVVSTLRAKKNIADLITGDQNLTAWL